LITRRLLVVFSLVALLGAACEPSSPGGDPADPTVASPLATPTPRVGGSAIVGVFGEPATLDPYSPAASDLTYALARPVFRSLYRFDATGAPVPDLVETLDASGDVVTITLEEATWSDGSPLTSKDVEATIQRAGPPSGLAAIDSVQRRGPSRLILTGSVHDWPEALARISFVLPSSGKRVYSGPFIVAGRTEGLQIVLEANPQAVETPYLDRLIVQFTEGSDLLLALLERGRIDAAWIPSTVNLDQRLDELGLSHEAVLGWERIILDLSGSDLSRAQRRDVAAALDRGAMKSGFVRDDGRIANTLAPEPGAGGAGGPFEPIFQGRGKGRGASLQLSAPSGDELLELLQRLAQVQLDSSGFDVELLNVDARRFYGDWPLDDPVDAALRRLSGAPGGVRGDDPRSIHQLPLFHVETVMAWGPGLAGVRVDPTIEGPLAHAHDWFVAAEGD
jgi:hypothetical protein